MQKKILSSIQIKEIYFLISVFCAYFLWDIKTFFIDFKSYYFFELRILFLTLIFFSIPLKLKLSYKIIIFVFAIIIQELISVIFYNNINIKNFLSFILIFLILNISLRYNELILKCIQISIEVILSLLFLFILFEYFSNNISPSNACNLIFFNQKFIFYENSHLIFFLPSAIIYYSYLSFESSSLKTNCLLIISIIIFFSFLSLTLVISFLFSIFLLYIFKLNKFIKIKSQLILLLILLASILISLSNENCNKRLKDVYKIFTFIELKKDLKIGEKKYSILDKNIMNSALLNQSSAVLVDHLIVTKESIIKYPFGVGINNYSYSFEKYTNKTINPDSLNYNDGRMVILKAITEFGIFLFYFIFIFIRFLINKNIDCKLKLLLFPMITSQLISGFGYFNGGFLITFFLIFSFYLKKDKSIKNINF